MVRRRSSEHIQLAYAGYVKHAFVKTKTITEKRKKSHPNGKGIEKLFHKLRWLLFHFTVSLIFGASFFVYSYCMLFFLTPSASHKTIKLWLLSRKVEGQFRLIFEIYTSIRSKSVHRKSTQFHFCQISFCFFYFYSCSLTTAASSSGIKFDAATMSK